MGEGGRRVGAEAGIPPGFCLPAGVESRVTPVPGPQGQPSSLPLPPGRGHTHQAGPRGTAALGRQPGRPARGPGCGCSAGPPPAGACSCLWSLPGTGVPWGRAGAPLTSQPQDQGPFAPLLRLLSPCLTPAPGVYSCPQRGWGQEGPAHLLGGATAHHTVPRGASPVWRTRLSRHLPAAGPGAAAGQEGPTNPDLALRLRPNPLTCLPSTRSSR